MKRMNVKNTLKGTPFPNWKSDLFFSNFILPCALNDLFNFTVQPLNKAVCEKCIKLIIFHCFCQKTWLCQLPENVVVSTHTRPQAFNWTENLCNESLVFLSIELPLTWFVLYLPGETKYISLSNEIREYILPIISKPCLMRFCCIQLKRAFHTLWPILTSARTVALSFK